MIELYYKRLQVYILPREAEHLTLRIPSSVFISRKATVYDYHKKVAEILLPNQKKHTLEALLKMSRIWRLETGEDVQEVERYYQSDNKNGMYVIRGRVLDEKEVIEDIDVAEDDSLLYEVQLNQPQLEKNGFFAFIPRQQVEKQRLKKAYEVLKQAGIKFDDSKSNENGGVEEQLMKMPLESYIDQAVGKTANKGRTGL